MYYTVHVVFGYMKKEPRDNSRVFAEEHIFALKCEDVFDEKDLWERAEKIFIREQNGKEKVKISEHGSSLVFEAEFVGARIRRIVSVSTLLRAEGKGGNSDTIETGDELTYLPMVFENLDDFILYSQSLKDQVLKLQVYSNPDDYHFYV